MKKITIIAAVCALVMTAAGCGEIEDSSPAVTESKAENLTESYAENSESEASSETEQTESASENNKEPVSSSAERTEGDTKGEQSFTSGAADFSAELFRQTAAEDISSGKNAFMSPESVLFALGMTANGAQGDTLAEMESVLGVQDIQSLNENLSALKLKANKSEYIDFSIANSLWVKNDETITLNDNFADTVKESFGADVFFEPFDNATKDSINGWVNENTNEMIPSILDDIHKDDVAYLINAIAFEANWAEQYTEHQIDEEGVFTSADGKTQTCTMLVGREDQYLHDDKAEGFLKYYEGYDYAFMAILPNKEIFVSDYLDTMTGESLSAFYNSKENGDVYTKIPEFSYDYKAELSEPLIAMGMEKAFTSEADFSAMAQTDTDVLYISEVIHKAHIELDRNGTKAAAATLVAMNKATAAPVEKEEHYVYLDRPFLYAIVDCESGLPVFLGAVNTAE